VQGAAPVVASVASLVAGAADRPASATDPQLDAFARDLVASGQAPPGRAWSLAELAVRHARAHGLPPALVSACCSSRTTAQLARAVVGRCARAHAGAPALAPLLGPRYGFDLTADSTNLGMGAHILAEGLAAARSAADVDRGLLRYNGCRRALVRAARRVRGHDAGPVREVPAPRAAARRAAGGALPDAVVHAVRRPSAPPGERAGRRAGRPSSRRSRTRHAGEVRDALVDQPLFFRSRPSTRRRGSRPDGTV
jgi:hypothetical protein